LLELIFLSNSQVAVEALVVHLGMLIRILHYITGSFIFSVSKQSNDKDSNSHGLNSQNGNVKIALEKDKGAVAGDGIYDLLFDQKLETATEGLESYHLQHLKTKISRRNALTIVKYILAMKTETNPSDNRRRSIITVLKLLCEFLKNKPFDHMTREDILVYLNMLKRPESEDPMHKWIGGYNLKLGCFIQFFKWLYYPDMEPGKREKPEVVQNIQFLRRKEKSVYRPSDLWTEEDHNMFLKYCGNKRDSCYHAMAIETSCRPHELLKLRVKDISFKSALENKQYAEIVVSGKTKPRSIPLFNSLPYVKDWIDHHHQGTNRNAFLISGFGKSKGRVITRYTLYDIYEHYKKKVFPKLLSDPDISQEDKERIRSLLHKPWNPYIRIALITRNIKPTFIPWVSVL
jgi:integrase